MGPVCDTVLLFATVLIPETDTLHTSAPIEEVSKCRSQNYSVYISMVRDFRKCGKLCWSLYSTILQMLGNWEIQPRVLDNFAMQSADKIWGHAILCRSWRSIIELFKR